MQIEPIEEVDAKLDHLAKYLAMMLKLHLRHEVAWTCISGAHYNVHAKPLNACKTVYNNGLIGLVNLQP
jgi:hypothetical protein